MVADAIRENTTNAVVKIITNMTIMTNMINTIKTIIGILTTALQTATSITKMIADLPTTHGVGK